MVQTYNIFGRQIASHYLAFGWLCTVFGGSYVALSLRSKGQPTTPPIQASSGEESDFIRQFLDKAEADEKKTGH